MKSNEDARLRIRAGLFPRIGWSGDAVEQQANRDTDIPLVHLLPSESDGPAPEAGDSPSIRNRNFPPLRYIGRDAKQAGDPVRVEVVCRDRERD